MLLLGDYFTASQTSGLGFFFPDVHPRRKRGSASPKSHMKPNLHSQELVSVEYLGHFKASESSKLTFNAPKH